MDGVTATVNYATEKARVTFAPRTRLADLIATVEKTGYTAQPVRRSGAAAPVAADPPPSPAIPSSPATPARETAEQATVWPNRPTTPTGRPRTTSPRCAGG